MALVSADVYLPLGVYDTIVSEQFRNSRKRLEDRSNDALVLAGRLKPGLTDAFATSRLDALSRQLEAAYPAENKNQVLSTNPLPRVSTSSTPSTDTGLHLLTALLMPLPATVTIAWPRTIAIALTGYVVSERFAETSVPGCSG